MHNKYQHNQKNKNNKYFQMVFYLIFKVFLGQVI